MSCRCCEAGIASHRSHPWPAAGGAQQTRESVYKYVSYGTHDNGRATTLKSDGGTRDNAKRPHVDGLTSEAAKMETKQTNTGGTFEPQKPKEKKNACTTNQQKTKKKTKQGTTAATQSGDYRAVPTTVLAAVSKLVLRSRSTRSSSTSTPASSCCKRGGASAPVTCGRGVPAYTPGPGGSLEMGGRVAGTPGRCSLPLRRL